MIPTSRRDFLRCLATAAACSPALLALGKISDTSCSIFFGTGGSISRGVYRASWNSDTGEIGELSLAAQVVSPTFLALASTGKEQHIYAVSEAGKTDSRVTAFATAPGNTALRTINDRTTLGEGPTYLSLSPDHKSLFVANYTSGSITSYRILSDGSISEPVSHEQYNGKGPVADRQASPHAHSALPSPDGRFLLVNDLGTDRIYLYRVDPVTARLTPNQPAFWHARPGSGPRHLAFHPNGRWVYCVNELDSTVELLDWSATKGTLSSRGHVSTLPEGFPGGTAFAGEIAASADGRNLYVGNRVAEDSIAVFQIAQDSGTLQLIQLASNGGKNTRHFAIDPSGRWMVLCNQNSGEIVVLARDRASGKLSEPKYRRPLSTVMFALFV